jgi:hypothetical protein
MLLASAQFCKMPGWTDAQIEPLILEPKAVEKYGTGQALVERALGTEMEGADYLGM